MLAQSFLPVYLVTRAQKVKVKMLISEILCFWQSGKNYEYLMYNQAFQNLLFLTYDFSRETQLSAKLNKNYFQVAASLYESVNTFFLQLRHWLASSVAKNQKLRIWHQTADQAQTKDQFCFIFNMCKYILEHFIYFLWSSFGVKYFDFQIFFFSAKFDTMSEDQLYFFINKIPNLSNCTLFFI